MIRPVCLLDIIIRGFQILEQAICCCMVLTVVVQCKNMGYVLVTLITQLLVRQVINVCYWNSTSMLYTIVIRLYAA